MPLAGPTAPARRALTELLAEARARTLLLVSPLTEQEVRRRPYAAVDSVLEELERIIRFEQIMLLEGGAEGPIQSYDDWFDQMMDVRQRVLERLNSGETAPEASRAYDRYRLVLEHEYQRDEAILQNIQCQGQPYRAPHQRRLPRGRGLADPGFMVRFAGGSVQIGQTDAEPAWPEERPLRKIELEPFWIDAMPVTNADYLTFMAAGGYSERVFWSDEGWTWLEGTGTIMPGNWSNAGGVWRCRWMGRDVPLHPGCPVSHICHYEAEAFAAFVGKRLPSELEWETAASWDPETQSRRSYPWGNMPPTPHVANLDQFALEPAAIGAFPGNISPLGCYGMIGDVWEWTASPFLPYSPESTAADLPVGRFDASVRVLRGGSWATRPGAIRASVRRPAEPAARHLFSGFRCARDA